MVNLRSFCGTRTLVSFILGILIGFFVAMMFILSSLQRTEWLPYDGHYRTPDDFHRSIYAENESGPDVDITGETHESESNNSIAIQLYQDVRVLCLVMTSADRHMSNARHIKRTWGKRCNKLVFISTEDDESLGAVAVKVTENHQYDWARTIAAFKHAYKSYYQEADWFLKTDDETYVVMENLRYLLRPYFPHDPVYFGQNINTDGSLDNMSGGYVLSSSALNLFVEKTLNNPHVCREDTHDVKEPEVVSCMRRIGINSKGSRDSKGRRRFFSATPEHILVPQRNIFQEFLRYRPSEGESGLGCCSDRAISFHHITPNRMYVMEYLIYSLQPYGIIYDQEPLSRIEDGEALWAKNGTKGNGTRQEVSRNLTAQLI